MRCVRRVQLAFGRDDPAPSHTRQRAILLLARRTGLDGQRDRPPHCLDVSVASVNCALQRCAHHAGQGCSRPVDPTGNPAPDDRQRALLERYVQAWEGADLDAFAALLKEDAILSMPPWRQWYRGRKAIRAFLAWAWDWELPGSGLLVSLPIAANRQPAFALYRSAQTIPNAALTGSSCSLFRTTPSRS